MTTSLPDHDEVRPAYIRRTLFLAALLVGLMLATIVAMDPPAEGLTTGGAAAELGSEVANRSEAASSCQPQSVGRLTKAAG
jgi:hypothetical protein